jgi:hypothetical protein
MKKEYIFHSILLVFDLVVWNLPEPVNYLIKIIITIVILLLFLMVLFNEKFKIIRKYWQEIISIVLLLGVSIILYLIYPDLFIPSIIILLASISISLLIISKYGQNIVYRTKNFLNVIEIDKNWNLNHWHGNCASISDNKMIFIGTTTPDGVDGSHINLANILEIDKTYEISCFAKSSPNTEGKFQLWCHDEVGYGQFRYEEKTSFKTPSVYGESFKVTFKAKYNKDIRIHLQYMPGVGKIEVNNVNLYKIII